MPARSRISQLPDDIRNALNEQLVENNFSNYVQLSEWLAGQGYQIGKSLIGRHGFELKAAMEKSMARARERIEVAKSLGGMNDGEKAALLEASEMVAIDQILDVMEGMSEWELSDKAELIPKLGRAIAQLSKSGVGSAQWKKEFQEDAERKANEAAALAATSAAKAEGVSESGLARIRAALGMTNG